MTQIVIDRALFVGRTYFDATFVIGEVPEGDDKDVADDYMFSIGGNAVMAALCCAKLGAKVELITTVSTEDRLGLVAVQTFDDYKVQYHGRSVKRADLSFVHPKDGYRAMVRGRGDLPPDFPHVEVDGFSALHLDGHQPDAALHYAKLCREKGILTSFDGGSVRRDTKTGHNYSDELLEFIDVAVVSERFCEQMKFETYEDSLEYLRGKGCRVGAVTIGDKGFWWYSDGSKDRHTKAVTVPKELVVDSTGAGDVFHGAYIYSYLRNPEGRWAEHFDFAAAAASHAVRFLGNEAGLPALATVESILTGSPTAVHAVVAQQ